MSKGKWDVCSHLSADRYKISLIGCGGGGGGVRQAGGGGEVQRGDAAAAPPPAPAPARLLDPEGEGEERLGPRGQELQTTLQEQEIQVSLCSVSKDTAD